MKKLITILLLTAIAQIVHAQKRDTVVLSVYNNSQRFMLYPMPFGKDKPDVDITATMLVASDTINVLKTDTKKDTTGKYPKRWVTERKCGKLPTDSLKGKVALLYMNEGCDISTQILNVQKAGAVVAILIHTTDNKDSVALPKKGGKFKYNDDSKVKIPCFTVRKGIGDKLTTMLPSLVGIKRPKADVGTIQALAIPQTPAEIAAAQAKQDSIYKAELDKYNAQHPSVLGAKGWSLSPNPARDEVVLHYNFEQTATIDIEIFTENGQVLTNYKLPDTQTGQLIFDVSSWQTGTYNVSLRSGSLKEVKRLVVAK